MDLTINRQTLEAERMIGVSETQKLVRAETLVSGAGREEVEILLADASAQTGSADIQTDRAALDGTVKCQAVYRLGSESAPRALTAQAAFNHIFEIKGAQSGMFSNTRVIVDAVNARYENGHMIFDVSVTLAVRVLELKPSELIAGVSADEGLETRYVGIVSRKTSAESRASALISDRVTLPAQLDARTALMDWAAVTDLSVKRDLGGVRVTGNVQCEALISSGAKAHPVALVRYAMPLNQLVELPEWLAGDLRASARVRSLNTEVEQAPDGEDGQLKLEAEVEASVSALGTDQIQALADAYATGTTNVSVKTRTMETCESDALLRVNEPFHGTMMLPSGAGSVGSVCAVLARANIGDRVPDENQTVLSGIVDAQVLYMSGDRETLARASAELPFEISVAETLDENDWVSVQVLNAEGSALMSDRVEIKCLLEISAEKRKCVQTEVADEITAEGENARAKGVLLVWPQAGESAWSIGKKYRAPMKTVVRANRDSDALSPGRALVIRL